jgi:hypothetical protein
MKDRDGNRPLPQLVEHQSGRAVAVDADQPREIGNDCQGLPERPELQLERHTRSRIQPDLANDCGSFHEPVKPLHIERFLRFEIAWVTPYAPRDVGFIALDDAGRLVEGESHGKNDPCACQLARGSVRTEMRMRIKGWERLHFAIDLLSTVLGDEP